MGRSAGSIRGSNGRGAIARAGEGAGLRPEPRPRGSAPWIPAKGSGPWNPLMGLFSGEGLPGPCEVTVGPPLRTNPTDRLQRASPFAGGPGGKAPGGVWGGAPYLIPSETKRDRIEIRAGQFTPPPAPAPSRWFPDAQ